MTSAFFSCINDASFFIAAFLTAGNAMVFSFVKDYRGKPQNTLYKLLLADLMLSATAITLNVFAGYKAANSEVMAVLYYLGHYVFFISHAALAPILCHYLLAVVGEIRLTRRVRSMMLGIPFMFAEMLIITNPATNYVYRYDDLLQLVPQWGEYFLYMMAVAYIAIAAAAILFHWHGIGYRRKAAFVFFLTITVAGMITQFFFRRFRVELFAEALGALGLMLAVENEGDRMDIITGFYNRSALISDMKYSFRKNSKGYVLCLRLIHTDTRRLSYTITAVAKKLKEHSRWYNIYRITPSALLLNLVDTDEDEAVKLTNIICGCMDEGILIQGHTVHCDYCVVRASYPREMRNLDDVLLTGDAELMPLSDNGRVYADFDLQEIFNRAETEDALHRGFAENRFEVYYQSVHRIGDTKPYAAEALIRLHDSIRGDLYPDEFIPVAEKNGMINEIGVFVLEEVCRFIKSGEPARLSMDHINVNLSVVQCAQKDFVRKLKQIVDWYGISPSFINFEITESVAAHDYRMLERVITEFKEAGFRFSMDDYGTGYSNMQSIFMLDFDVIKIDKSILWEAQNSSIGRIILENSIQMIRRMRKKILVEGVETAEQMALLRELGVDYLQGYYFSKPVPEKEFLALYAGA